MVVHWNLISKTFKFLQQLNQAITLTAVRSCMIKSSDQAMSALLAEALVRKEVNHDK